MVRTVTKIPPTRIFIPSEDKEWILHKIKEILDSAILTNAENCRQLEASLAKYLGVRNVVATNSGTGALEILLRGTGAKGEVIVTTNTFAATIYAIQRAGCRPILADVNDELYLDSESVKKGITPKTFGVVVMHVGGHVSDELAELKELCQEKDLLLFEDAAHSLGTKYDGTFTCNLGVGGASSFFPTKVIASAEGGFVATNDDELDAKARLIRDQGKQSGNFCSVQGYNWRMNELQAVIALSQLRRAEEFISHRAKIAKTYDSQFEEGLFESTCERMNLSKKCRPNWYKYIVFIKGGLKETVKTRLMASGVTPSGDVYDFPCHIQPAFAALGYSAGDFPVAERMAKSHLCLPISASMTEEQADFVVSCLSQAIK